MEVPFVYEPQMLPMLRRPRLYINNGLFCKGELLKILVRVPEERKGLRIRIFPEQQELEKVKGFELMSDPPYSTRQFSIFDTSNTQSVGSYVVQLGPSKPGTNAEITEVLAEHRFHVLTPEQYKKYWRSLFGDVWDERIYWDTLKPPQGKDLIRGRVEDNLFAMLGREVELGGEALYRFLGPITTICMASEMEYLPFSIDCVYAPLPARLPHIDLTKLMWLLNTLTSSWADMAFFANSTKLSIGVIENELRLSFEADTTQPPYTKYEKLRDTPRLFDIVKESAEDIPCEINRDKGKSWLTIRAE